MQSTFTLTKAYSIKKPKRLILSLVSQFGVLIISLCTFFFFGFDIFKFEFTTKQGVEIVPIGGYQAWSYKNFGAYVNVFVLLTLIVAFILLAIYLMQIFLAMSIHGLNIILLGVQLLCFEFLICIYSLGGYILFGLYILDFIQYFIFLDKHQKIDYWIFGLMFLLVLAMLPSALVSSSIFQ